MNTIQIFSHKNKWNKTNKNSGFVYSFNLDFDPLLKQNDINKKSNHPSVDISLGNTCIKTNNGLSALVKVFYSQMHLKTRDWDWLLLSELINSDVYLTRQPTENGYYFIEYSNFVIYWRI